MSGRTSGPRHRWVWSNPWGRALSLPSVSSQKRASIRDIWSEVGFGELANESSVGSMYTTEIVNDTNVVVERFVDTFPDDRVHVQNRAALDMGL